MAERFFDASRLQCSLHGHLLSGNLFAKQTCKQHVASMSQDSTHKAQRCK
jgi:hypothetical protein